MFLLWVALLIQTSYYIVHRAYQIILLLIILTLGLRKFSKNEYIFLLLPMILSQILYVCWCSNKETFKKNKKNFINNKKKDVKRKIEKKKTKNKINKLLKAKAKHSNQTLKKIHNLTKI